MFEPYKLYSAEREGKVLYLKDDQILPTDNIIARKRGKTSWNSKIVDEVAQATDGKITVSIFSPLNWDNKGDKQLDKDTALYALSHELGHTIWTTILHGPGIFNNLQQRGTTLPCSPTAYRLLPVLAEWKSLTESTMQPFLEYKDIFSREHASDSTGFLEQSLNDLSKEEDFAISWGHYLFWRNLQSLDQQRFSIQQEIYQSMG